MIIIIRHKANVYATGTFKLSYCLSNNYKLQDIFVALKPHKNEGNDSSHLAQNTTFLRFIRQNNLSHILF